MTGGPGVAAPTTRKPAPECIDRFHSEAPSTHPGSHILGNFFVAEDVFALYQIRDRNVSIIWTSIIWCLPLSKGQEIADNLKKIPDDNREFYR